MRLAGNRAGSCKEVAKPTTPQAPPASSNPNALRAFTHACAARAYAVRSCQEICRSRHAFMGWAACLGMHHESVIGLRPDDATMTEIKSMLASEFVTISLIVPGIAGRSLQTDAAPFFSLVQCGKVRDLKPLWLRGEAPGTPLQFF